MPATFGIPKTPLSRARPAPTPPPETCMAARLRDHVPHRILVRGKFMFFYPAKRLDKNSLNAIICYIVGSNFLRLPTGVKFYVF